MSFIDAHDFSVGLVSRVLGIASSTYYEWRARATLLARRRCEDAELLALIDEIHASHEFAGTYGPEAGVAGAAPPRGAGRPQTGRADHARERTPRRLPAQRVEGWLDEAESAAHRRPDLLDRDYRRDRAQHQVGGRSDADPHR